MKKLLDFEVSGNLVKKLNLIKSQEREKESEFLYETFIKDWIVETHFYSNLKDNTGNILK